MRQSVGLGEFRDHIDAAGNVVIELFQLSRRYPIFLVLSRTDNSAFVAIEKLLANCEAGDIARFLGRLGIPIPGNLDRVGLIEPPRFLFAALRHRDLRVVDGVRRSRHLRALHSLALQARCDRGGTSDMQFPGGEPHP